MTVDVTKGFWVLGQGPVDLAAAAGDGWRVAAVPLARLTPASIDRATQLGIALISLWPTPPGVQVPDGRDGRHAAIQATDVALTLRQRRGAIDDPGYDTAIYIAYPTPTPTPTDLNAVSQFLQAAADVLRARGFSPGFWGPAALWAVAQRWGYRHWFAQAEGEDSMPGGYSFTAGVAVEVGGVDAIELRIVSDPGAWNAYGSVRLVDEPVTVEPVAPGQPLDPRPRLHDDDPPGSLVFTCAECGAEHHFQVSL